MPDLLARLEERPPTNWDVPLSPEQYIEEIGVTNCIRAASVDPTANIGIAPVFQVASH